MKKVYLVMEEEVVQFFKPETAVAVVSQSEISEAVAEAVKAGLKPILFLSKNDAKFALKAVRMGAVLYTVADPRDIIKKPEKFSVCPAQLDFLKKPRKGYMVVANAKSLIAELAEAQDAEGS